MHLNHLLILLYSVSLMQQRHLLTSIPCSLTTSLSNILVQLCLVVICFYVATPMKTSHLVLHKSFSRVATVMQQLTEWLHSSAFPPLALQFQVTTLYSMQHYPTVFRLGAIAVMTLCVSRIIFRVWLLGRMTMAFHCLLIRSICQQFMTILIGHCNHIN